MDKALYVLDLLDLHNPIYIYILQYYIQPHVSCSPDTDAAQQAALQNACDDAEAICLKHK